MDDLVERCVRAAAEADGLHPLDDPMKHYAHMIRAVIPLVREDCAGVAEEYGKGWFDHRVYCGQEIAAAIRQSATALRGPDEGMD